MIVYRLSLLWRDLRLNTKLGISFGALLSLMIMLACSGYFMLITVQGKTKSSLQASMAIQRQVLEIKAGIERARKMQKDFFINWSKQNITRELVSSSREVANQIQKMKEHSKKLKSLIAKSEFNSKFEKSQINLNFFLSAAERFSAVFHEATTLRITLMNLEKEIKESEEHLLQLIQASNDQEIIAAFWKMQAHTNAYLRSRSRPKMQTTFNTARRLRQFVEDMNNLNQKDKEKIFQSLHRYLKTAEELLPLDVSLRSKFTEFDLQVEAVDPIITDLIHIADREMSVSKKQITKTTWLAVSLLFIALVSAIALAMLIAFVLNKSITQNVLRLTHKAKELRQGHLETRVEITNADELGQLAETINAMAEQIQKQVNELQKLARTDQLTGIANRHSFLQCLDFELKRLKRTSSSLSLLMFDIDHFKQINDTYGHAVGDEILKELVGIVGRNLREVDILARWGGEEFLVLAPDTELKYAQMLAQRLRRTVAGHAFPSAEHITISFGVTEYGRGDSVDSLLARVDKSMYLAKQKGRNTVEASYS